MSRVVLGIETSCDETSVAVLKDDKILSNIVSSQVEIHARFGGIVPEIASRNHLKNLPIVYRKALKTAEVDPHDLDAVAVTQGPGLVGALLVGLSFAKGLSLSLDIPMVPVNHLQGHIYAAYLSHRDLTPPFIALIVSGGHTEIVLVRDGFKVLGKTLDDAAGEAFDKVARVLGLGYPGGPAIEKAALEGSDSKYDFPRALLSDGNFNFSFSGLKTSVMYFIKKNPSCSISDVAASFQKAVVDVLVEKTLLAAEKYGIDRVVISGGVAANTCLRREMSDKAISKGLKLYVPPKNLCTDNAAMIARVGLEKLSEGNTASLEINAEPGLQF